MTSNNISTLPHALEFISRGVHVSPGFGINNGNCGCKNQSCWRPGKHQFIQENPTYSSLVKNEVISMWSKEGLNLIVHTGKKSELLVIDVDHRDGGLKVFNSKLAHMPLFNNTYTVKSGSGGLHFYYLCNENIYSCRDGIANGIDICCNPNPQMNFGYVVGPGSTHATGNQYEVIHDRPFATIRKDDLEAIKLQVRAP